MKISFVKFKETLKLESRFSKCLRKIRDWQCREEEWLTFDWLNNRSIDEPNECWPNWFGQKHWSESERTIGRFRGWVTWRRLVAKPRSNLLLNVGQAEEGDRWAFGGRFFDRSSSRRSLPKSDSWWKSINRSIIHLSSIGPIKWTEWLQWPKHFGESSETMPLAALRLPVRFRPLFQSVFCHISKSKSSQSQKLTWKHTEREMDRNAGKCRL